MKTNSEKVVIQSLQGSIHHPTMSNHGYWVGYDGISRISMSTGSITYNYKIGDNCMDVPGDHVEPGVSLKNSDSSENTALQALACIGNEATIISGDAKGKKGFVTGKHGGVNHVMIYFEEAILDLLNINDRIAIKAKGQGLILHEHPKVKVMNIDPELFLKLNLKELDNGTIEVPVTTIVPAYLMGAGLGETTMIGGDYDIMTQDKKANEEFHLNDLRFGDLVFIQDHDNLHGPHYFQGSGSIGIVAHSDSFTSGHGPGLTIIMTSHENLLKPRIDPHANIANILLPK